MQNSTLNYIVHRFIAHGTCNYRHGASFSYFHLTAVSQRDHHASVQIDGQVELFDQLRGNKSMAGATVYQSYNIQWLDQLALFSLFAALFGS